MSMRAVKLLDRPVPFWLFDTGDYTRIAHIAQFPDRPLT